MSHIARAVSAIDAKKTTTTSGLPIRIPAQSSGLPRKRKKGPGRALLSCCGEGELAAYAVLAFTSSGVVRRTTKPSASSTPLVSTS